jgi:hypothetical protein
MAAWVGCSLAWRRARAIDGIDSALEFLVTFAPMMTLREQDARRLSVLGRPGVAIHYGWFAFTFGMNLEVAIRQTESGPWSAADAPPTFLPGVNVGLGVAF